MFLHLLPPNMTVEKVQLKEFFKRWTRTSKLSKNPSRKPNGDPHANSYFFQIIKNAKLEHSNGDMRLKLCKTPQESLPHL